MVDFEVVADALGWGGGKGLPFGALLHVTPPRRPRALTGPLGKKAQPPGFWQKMTGFSNADIEQYTASQKQCALLTVLPLDIRMMIYDLVLGGMYFHIGTSHIDSSGRMLCFICQRPRGTADDDHQECLAPSGHRPSSAPREDYAQATGLLPLLVTCRQVYSEAIETLYSSNTFEFWQNQVAFRFLKVMIPPQRLRCIRRFRWAMQFPHHPYINARSQRDWSDLFSFFANETYGLQHLHLKLKRNHPVEAIIRETPDERGVGWMKPIVLMAIDAHRKRGCLVEIVTNGIVHDPVSIYHYVLEAHSNEAYNSVLDLCCAEMHKRIRLSLGDIG